MSFEMTPAGSLAAWFDHMVGAREHGTATDVPCGSCTACCTSSLFIRVEPGEAALDHIPAELLHPAPGEPGVFVLGYDEHGRCPMLGANGCTVYDHRPRGCRVFDCRLFAATGVLPESTHVDLRRRSGQWTFSVESARDRAVRAALDRATDPGAEGFADALRAFATAAGSPLSP